MKHNFISLGLTVLLLLTVSQVALLGQCNVVLGVDTVLCWGFESQHDSIVLQSYVSDGVPPYTYNWETSYETFSGTQTASDFLIDTTVANPILVNSTFDTLELILTVIASDNQTCSDTLIVTFSQWEILAIETHYIIAQGDTITIIDDCHLPNFPYSAEQPFASYAWTPNYNLSDSTAANPLAWPDTSVMYIAKVTDKFGCTREIGCGAIVTVETTRVENLQQSLKDVLLYPNPAVDHIIIVPPEGVARPMYLQLHDLFGRVALKREFEGTATIQLASELPPGTYFYTIRSGRGDMVQTGKLVRL